MKKIAFSALMLLLPVSQALASPIYCADNQDGDYLIDLQVAADGSVISALYSNQDHGDYDNRALSPSEYTYENGKLTYGGDLFSCYDPSADATKAGTTK